jgi:hypothetical protein
MHPVDFQERVKQFDIDPKFHTYSVSADYYENDRPFIIDLSVEGFRNLITFEARKNDIKFIVIDNLASLTAGTNENTKEGWDPINQWLLKLRHMGISIFVVHHMSKGKDQRGTSARMDNVDSTLYIKKPKYYSASDGARFILDFKKHRGKIDSDSKELVKNRQLWYKQNGQGEWFWDFGSGMLGNRELLIDIVESGLSQQKIGEKHGLKQVAVSRRKKEFMENGYLAENNGKLDYTEKGNEFINQPV